MKTTLDFRLRLSLNRKASQPEIKALRKHIAEVLLTHQIDGKCLYDIKWGRHPKQPLKVEHHIVSKIKPTSEYVYNNFLFGVD